MAWGAQGIKSFPALNKYDASSTHKGVKTSPAGREGGRDGGRKEGREEGRRGFVACLSFRGPEGH